MAGPPAAVQQDLRALAARLGERPDLDAEVYALVDRDPLSIELPDATRVREFDVHASSPLQQRPPQHANNRADDRRQ